MLYLASQKGGKPLKKKDITKQPAIDDDIQSDDDDHESDGFDDMQEIPLDITSAVSLDSKPEKTKPSTKKVCYSDFIQPC